MCQEASSKMPERVKIFRRVASDELHIGSENETLSWGNAEGDTYIRNDIKSLTSALWELVERKMT